jgi:phage gp45-like
MNPAAFRAQISGTDDSGELQLADFAGYAGEQLAGVHRMQAFGFHSNPPAQSHGIALPLRGQRGLAVLLGGEYQPARPTNRPVGSSCLYDQWGNVVSMIQTECRIVHATVIHLVAPTIILEGDVKLGGPSAATPAAMQGSIDSDGDAITGNVATKVFVE